MITFPGNRSQNTALDRRIDAIIDGIAPCSPQSAPALLRLLPLLKNKFLTNNEKIKIAEKVWGPAPDYQTLPETGLLESALLKIPTQDLSAVKHLVRRYLFQAEGNNLFNPTRLMSIANVALAEQAQELPSENQATDYFGRLVAWRPSYNDNDLFKLSHQEEKRKGELIGEALAQSIVPALSAQTLTEENFQKLCDFYTEVDSPKAIIAFPLFAAANPSLNDRVEKLIRQGLQERTTNKMACSSYALLKWRELHISAATDSLMIGLVYMIGTSRIIGLNALLWTVNQLYNKGHLPKISADSLAEILPVVFDNADYKNTSHSSREAASVSLVRAACVRLARDILAKSQDKNTELIRILENAKQDALPEVRFAETTND